MRAPWHRIYPFTIWHPDARQLTLVPHRFRPIYTILLPIVDVLFMALGAIAFIFGSKAVIDTTLELFNPIWATVIGMSAALALVGLVFDQAVLEICAKVVLVIAVLAYTFLLGINFADGVTSALLSITVALGFALIPTARVLDLTIQIAKRPRK